MFHGALDGVHTLRIVPDRSDPPSESAEELSVRDQVGNAARYLQRLVARGDHSVARGELLVLGAFAAPVVLQLSKLLSPPQVDELSDHLTGVLVQEGKRSRNRAVLAQLSHLFLRLSSSSS